MDKKLRCSECRYYWVNEENGFSYCRFLPPYRNYIIGGEVIAEWPKVRGEDWCFSYRGKDVDKEG